MVKCGYLEVCRCQMVKEWATCTVLIIFWGVNVTLLTECTDLLVELKANNAYSSGFEYESVKYKLNQLFCLGRPAQLTFSYILYCLNSFLQNQINILLNIWLIDWLIDWLTLLFIRWLVRIWNVHQQPSRSNESDGTNTSPRYADGIYLSEKCRPSVGERVLLQSLNQRPKTAVHEAVLAVSANPSVAADNMDDFVRVSIQHVTL